MLRNTSCIIKLQNVITSVRSIDEKMGLYLKIEVILLLKILANGKTIHIITHLTHKKKGCGANINTRITFISLEEAVSLVGLRTRMVLNV